jgi:hypothetical protein
VTALDNPLHDAASARRRRAQLIRRSRLIVLALVIAYFFLPYGVRIWIPVWLPFAAAVALEAQFFLSGIAAGRSGPGLQAERPDRGPQARDLAELGGEQWRDVHAVEHVGERHFVPTAGLTDEEIHERVEAYLRDPDAVLAGEATSRGDPVRSSSPPGLRQRHPYLARLAEALAVLTVVAGILFYASRPHGWSAVSEANRARAEAVFSREATAIAGHPAQVSCDTAGNHVGFVRDADGVAEVGGTHAYLVPSLCDALYQLAFKHRVQSFSQTARAIAVLAHEAWHLGGVSDEGLANCYGFQSGVEIGVDLGLSEGRARSMMRQQLATNASDSAGDSRYLVPAGCRNGGEYDLQPASGAFP